MAIPLSVSIGTTVSASGPAIPLHILHTVACQGKARQVPHKYLASWLHRLGCREVSRASVHHYSLAGLHSATDAAMTATAE